MSDTAGWCLIESDPGVFTELIRELGNVTFAVIVDIRRTLLVFSPPLFQEWPALKSKNSGRWTTVCSTRSSESNRELLSRSEYSNRYRSCYRPVHGLIFLFRWIGEDQPDGPIVKDSRIEKIFFAQQVRSSGGSLLLYSVQCNDCVGGTSTFIVSCLFLRYIISNYEMVLHHDTEYQIWITAVVE